ncbi:MAG: hypothetical protein R2713_23725 [Ilumatobacteraceae bacterium]
MEPRATVLHLGQAIAILVLAGAFAITVTSTFPAGPPGSEALTPEALFRRHGRGRGRVPHPLAALDHALTGTVMRHTYETDSGAASTGSAGSSTP